VLAFSRILNDEETVIVANADGKFGASLDIIVDARLNEPNTQYHVLYSNKTTPAAPSAVRQTGTVTVHEGGRRNWQRPIADNSRRTPALRGADIRALADWSLPLREEMEWTSPVDELWKR
jgi:hypothetical protein